MRVMTICKPVSFRSLKCSTDIRNKAVKSLHGEAKDRLETTFSDLEKLEYYNAEIFPNMKFKLTENVGAYFGSFSGRFCNGKQVCNNQVDIYDYKNKKYLFSIEKDLKKKEYSFTQKGKRLNSLTSLPLIMFALKEMECASNKSNV